MTAARQARRARPGPPTRWYDAPIVPRIATSLLAAALSAAAALPTPARAAPPTGEASPGEGPGTADAAVAVEPQAALTQKIAVWRLDALGLDAELVTRLEALFRSELDRLATHPLPGRAAMDAAAGKDRKLRDCTGADACLTQLGRALGVDVMVTGAVAALGDSYILDIKAVDVATGKPLRRIASEPLRGSPDELIDAVRVAAYTLLAPDQLHGAVLVLSDLVGATVSLDGAVVGRTPLPGPLARQPLGRHRLRVEADGYVPFDEEIDVRFQKSTRVVVRLASVAPTPTDDGPRLDRVVVRAPDRPWYATGWAYAGAGVAAAALGAVIGWRLGRDEVISCVPPATDPRCGR